MEVLNKLEKALAIIAGVLVSLIIYINFLKF